jgi:hypothetical protein
MDKSERDHTRATARRSLATDRGQGTNFTSAWLLMQRARLTELKTASADLEELIGIYEAELRDALASLSEIQMRDQPGPSSAAYLEAV